MRRDTLWQIAAKARQGGSVQQTMLAIQALNPDAFYNGNINQLKVGQVLRLPDQQQIAAIPRARPSRKWPSSMRPGVRGAVWARVRASSTPPGVTRPAPPRRVSPSRTTSSWWHPAAKVRLATARPWPTSWRWPKRASTPPGVTTPS
ncbi:LysM peptidoglycan-binding domain-containing protein [Pseudomonas qingdaonensis]|nr:LysM peptidoglycan-binding domain-containing protein [Pseudomonas qingdaonensis]